MPPSFEECFAFIGTQCSPIRLVVMRINTHNKWYCLTDILNIGKARAVQGKLLVHCMTGQSRCGHSMLPEVSENLVYATQGSISGHCLPHGTAWHVAAAGTCPRADAPRAHQVDTGCECMRTKTCHINVHHTADMERLQQAAGEQGAGQGVGGPFGAWPSVGAPALGAPVERQAAFAGPGPFVFGS